MLLIFLSGVLWGTIGIFEKTFAAFGAEGSISIFLRMSFAFLITFGFSLVRSREKFFHVSRRVFLACVLLGIISNGVFNIFYSNSIRLNGMAIAAVLMYTAPVFTSIASKILFGEKFSRVKILALAINILGCILTVTGGNILNPEVSLIGICCGIGSGFCYGMAPIFAKLSGDDSDPLIVSAYSFMFAAIFLAVFVPPGFGIFEAKFLGLGFLYGLIPTALTYVLYYAGIGKLSSSDMSKVPVVASIEPVTAVLIGSVIYSEQIGFVNLVGMILVISGIILSMRK